MDEPHDQQWFLRKHEDGQVFGPLPFAQLARWASAAQVAPHDMLSIDQKSWMKAPMLPQLGMDWLVEVTTDRYYGPTTLGSIQEFVRLGEVSGDTFLINSCDGSRMQILEMPALLEPPVVETEEVAPEIADGVDVVEPHSSGMSIALQTRIRELEQSLREERRALREAEERYSVLEAKYRQLVLDQP